MEVRRARRETRDLVRELGFIVERDWGGSLGTSCNPDCWICRERVQDIYLMVPKKRFSGEVMEVRKLVGYCCLRCRSAWRRSVKINEFTEKHVKVFLNLTAVEEVMES